MAQPPPPAFVPGYVNLLSLPTEVLRHVMSYATLSTLAALSETNCALNTLVTADDLWRDLTRRRFRLTPRPTLPKRFEMMGGVCWRTLYANWHRQMRMPVSRHSGPTFKAFARGCGAGAAVWMTVVSAEDCRLKRGMLRVHIVVQNVAACAPDGVVEVRGNELAVRVSGGGGVVTVNRGGRGGHGGENEGAGLGGETPACRISLRPAGIEELVPSGQNRVSSQRWRLRLNEFVVLPVEIRIAGAEVEVDALERLEEVLVPVVLDGERQTVVARLSDKVLWDAYDLLPGGWWARVG